MAAAAIVGEDDPADTPVEVARVDAPLAGETLAESAVRSRTGVTVITTERDGEVITGITPEFVPEPGDTFVVVGTGAGIARFEGLEA